MSGKYSENKFFFANYGCCIPTESYAWILVALFVTTIVVLLFCMLATATIRWMYKRRMRKRLHDLKRKFLVDQMKAQEFDAKLNFMAQKNKSCKNDDSKEGEKEKEKLTIFVDPAQKEAQHLAAGNNKKKASSLQKAVGPGNGPVYDRDETPIAQSTLASQSKTDPKMRNENRWLYLPKAQKPKPLSDDTTPIPTPTPNYYVPPPPPPPHPVIPPTQYRAPPPSHGPPPPPPHHLYPPIIPAGSYFDIPKKTSPPKKSPPKKTPPKIEVDFGTSPIIPLDPNDVSPEVSKTDPLAPPTSTGATTSSGVSSGTSPSEFTTTPTTSGLPTTPSSSIPSSTPLTTETTTPSSTDFASTKPPSTIPSPPKQKVPSPKSNKSPGDNVKQNLQYGMDDIVSPVVPDNGSDHKEVAARKEGAGGRSEWKYYQVEQEKNKRRGSPSLSTITKSSTSNRRSSGSWLFDSTGSNRYETGTSGSGQTSSIVSSSILKTDSSYYKTASIEQFPHGAFTFE